MADEGSSEDEDYDPTRQDEEDLVEKPAKRSRHRFIDDTAEVEDEEDEDDEDEDEEDEEGGDGNEEGDNELFDDKAVERENRRLDAERRKAEEERLEDEVRKRYERADEFYEDEDYGDDTRFTELPDAQRDPKLWLIKCKPGQERDLIIRLMQKYLDSAQTDQPLSIKSALCTEIKGYIYVEAYKEAHVREATQGMNGLFYRITQVPAREMTDVMRVRSAEKKALVPGAWVRMRRNDIYKDDLAQVLDLDVDGTRARVRLVPRLRLSDEDEESKRRVRPPPKLFDVEDMRAKGEDVGSVQRGARGRAVHFFENQEFEDGFLIRHLSVKGLKWENVTPTLAELERFKSALGATAEADLLAAHQKLSSTDFRAGDAVKVVDGDLKHLVGSVTQVSSDGTTVTILPDHAKLRASGPIALSAELLAKYFKMGDHVKVIGGSHHLGETGMVVRVGSSTDSEGAGAKGRNAANATVLHILTDLSQQEITVRAAHVQECAEVSAGLEQLGVYSLYDLVDVASIGAPVVGVVVKVEHSAFKVLTTHNVVESVDVGAMGRKRTSRNAVALDSANARIEIGTRVADLATNAEGTVKHIFKSFLFIHNHETRVNAGMSCVRARQVRVVSGKSGGPQYQGYDSADAAACDAAIVARNASFASLLVPQSPSQLQADGGTPNGMLGGGYGGGAADGFGGAGGFAGGFGGGGSLDGGKGYGKGGGKGGDGRGGRGRGRGGVDSDVGRRMQVTRGSFKGYYGTVKAVTGNTARLELEGKEKIISVAKANLRKAEDKRAGAGGGHSCGMGAAAGFGAGGFGGARPVWNDLDGSRTPTHLGACATPLRNDGFRTPMHDQDWGRTPLHDSFAPMTPMHDAGSRTPLHGSVWDPMAPTTPLHRPSTPSYGSSTPRLAEDSFEQQWAAMGGGGGGGAPDALSSSSASFMGGLSGGAGLGESPFAGGASNLFGSGSGSISGNSSWAAGSSAADASGFGSLSGGGGGGGTSGGAAELLPERVLVTLSVPGAEGKRGVIAEVRPDGEYEVSLVDEVRTLRATGAQLEVVRPSKRDSVIILRGDNKGLSGQLIGIDNEDGIVKMTLPGGGTDIKIIDLDSCAATG